jgi:hypothetical protein
MSQAAARSACGQIPPLTAMAGIDREPLPAHTLQGPTGTAEPDPVSPRENTTLFGSRHAARYSSACTAHTGER